MTLTFAFAKEVPKTLTSRKQESKVLLPEFGQKIKWCRDINSDSSKAGSLNVSQRWWKKPKEKRENKRETPNYSLALFSQKKENSLKKKLLISRNRWGGCNRRVPLHFLFCSHLGPDLLILSMRSDSVFSFISLTGWKNTLRKFVGLIPFDT